MLTCHINEQDHKQIHHVEDFNDIEDIPVTINMQSVHSLHGSITAMNQILEIL